MLNAKIWENNEIKKEKHLIGPMAIFHKYSPVLTFCGNGRDTG